MTRDREPPPDRSPHGALDFGFLTGSFDVISRRRRNLVDPASPWISSPATAIARNYLDGLVSVDEMWFPDTQKYGMSLRVFDPVIARWSVYWLDSDHRALSEPVQGTWRGDRCWLTGPATVAGERFDFSYEWSDVTMESASWEQCISFDRGVSWHPNWQMTWQRRTDPPPHHGRIETNDDFEFLRGSWTVSHARNRDPLAGQDSWVEFDGAQWGDAYFDGAVSVDELELDNQDRGLAFRIYDDAADLWSIYWVHSRGGGLQTPVHGRFRDGIGRFFSREQIGGQLVDVRFVWDEIDATSARWTQSFSFDDASTWEPNWRMRLARADRPGREPSR